ncbi:hypothetical protein AGDE_13343 [Angomonas deanei]|uniref:RanBP2-type domain-containing protein n=1 Tax=Angomonas deanei TaxID=59799 RepID=A0A7G2CEH4_9TRYP|nr:hypothetical protein AGDE_13343 [Angomonas deanei]CAD2218288.1 hypothetical protein, conserved [Angomonas deanei]|eukprot:EPY22464.1 hypothetical protein AGDE_13343 [Angomonas deanei]
MRSINIQSKKVAFKEVTAQDIIPISPKERPGTMSSTSKPTSLAFTAEVWPCPVCNYLNAPSAKKCASCDTLHIVTAHHVNPNGENGLTKKKPHKTNIGDTITLAEIEQYCKKEKL